MLRKPLSRPIIKIGEEYDNHARCRSCKRYGADDCIPPHDIDTFLCQSYVRKFDVEKFNPSRRE
jgi:hypothetical protein